MMFLNHSGEQFTFSLEDGKKHSFILGPTRKSKSFLSARVQVEARKKGHLLVDTQLYREGRGLRPYEHEYARRLTNGNYGLLPRELRGKPATFISDVSRPKRKRIQKHYVTTSTGARLDRQLIRAAQEQLEMQAGVWMTQPQLIALMEEYGIDGTLEEVGEAETQIREMLADALSMSVIGRSWPKCEALFNSASKEDTGFAEELDQAARAAGYKVH